MTLSFDDSLEALVRCLRGLIPVHEIEGGVVLRDVSGRLSFFAPRTLSDVDTENFGIELGTALGPYSRADLPITGSDTPGANPILTDRSAVSVDIDGLTIRLLDRRIVGDDWMRPPSAPSKDGPPRLVFASLKGGVGRSTAISVIAADASRQGKNVLVVDYDLEAPGIGSLLLDDERRPKFGTLDYLVESAIRTVDDSELASFVGTSHLTDGAGEVDVIPVFGRSTLDHPSGYMAKLARAMVEAIGPDGNAISVRDRLCTLLDRFESRRTYDLVLIDARAGVAELSAGPILGVRATTVFLFTTAQQQSIEGYRLLFAHLSTLVAEPPSPWSPFQMVHAKASLDDRSHERLTDELWSIFSEFLYEETIGPEGFNFTASDPSAPHTPIPILFDGKFADWDPVTKPTLLSRPVYEATFRRLLDQVQDK